MNFLVFSALCIGFASAAGVGLHHGYGGIIQQQPQLLNVPYTVNTGAVAPSRSYSYFYRGQPQAQLQSTPVVYQQPQQQLIQSAPVVYRQPQQQLIQTVPVQHIPQRLVQVPQQQVVLSSGGYSTGHNLHILPQNLGHNLQLSSGTILGGSTLNTSPYILGHK